MQQRYAHYNPNLGNVLEITESDSMDYIVPMSNEQYQLYLQAPDTWRVKLDTLEFYQVDPIPDYSDDEQQATIESRTSVLEDTVGAILETILPELMS